MSQPDMNESPQPQLQTPNKTMIYYSRPSLSNPIPTQLWPPPPWVTSPPPPPLSPPPSPPYSPPRTRSSTKKLKVQLPKQPGEQLPKQPEEQLPKQPKEQLPKMPEEQLPKMPEEQLPKMPEEQLPKRRKQTFPERPEPQCPRTCLEEFTLKLKIPLPHYEAVIVESEKRLKFKVTVSVNGEKFTSPNTFQTRKAAEIAIANIALMHLLQKRTEEGAPLHVSLCPEDIVSYKTFLNKVGLVYCKSILHNFAAKANMEYPSYNTLNPDRSVPVPLFVSSLVFNGTSYTRGAQIKKEAEQLVARDVITSLLDVPEMGNVLGNVINSKWKEYAATKK